MSIISQRPLRRRYILSCSSRWQTGIRGRNEIPKKTGISQRPLILITDDDPAIRTLLVEVLEGADYEVATAQDGHEALKCLQERVFDLVITDIYMPDKDGIELIMELRNLHPEMRVIAISGGSPGLSSDLLNPAKRLGAMRILRKPVLRADLLQAVKEVLVEPVSGFQTTKR